jgi:hypothetical protein
MKKNYSFYLTLLMIPICAALFISFSGGQNVYYVSGSISDNTDPNNDFGGGPVGNCTLCHNTSAPILNSSVVSLTVPADYELNTTYAINVSSSSENARQGFQLSAEDATGIKVGDFTDDGANNQVFNSPLGDRGEAVTHTAPGNLVRSWTFDWTSPSSDVGPITFYAAVNESNFDFNSTGDIIHLKQSSSNLLSTENFVFNDLKLFPNPGTDLINIQLPSGLQNGTKLEVFDLSGKRIYSERLNALENTVNVSSWQTGVYLFNLSNENATLTKRFVKQ